MWIYLEVCFGKRFGMLRNIDSSCYIFQLLKERRLFVRKMSMSNIVTGFRGSVCRRRTHSKTKLITVCSVKTKFFQSKPSGKITPKMEEISSYLKEVLLTVTSLVSVLGD
jgi:hypothetical protein